MFKSSSDFMLATEGEMEDMALLETSRRVRQRSSVNATVCGKKRETALIFNLGVACQKKICNFSIMSTLRGENCNTNFFNYFLTYQDTILKQWKGGNNADPFLQ